MQKEQRGTSHFSLLDALTHAIVLCPRRARGQRISSRLQAPDNLSTLCVSYFVSERQDPAHKLRDRDQQVDHVVCTQDIRRPWKVSRRFEQWSIQ